MLNCDFSIDPSNMTTSDPAVVHLGFRNNSAGQLRVYRFSASGVWESKGSVNHRPGDPGPFKIFRDYADIASVWQVKDAHGCLAVVVVK